MPDYCIVGSGTAGVFAAKKIRECDPEAVINLFTDDSCTLFSKPRLPEYLAGQCDRDDLMIFPPEWYQKQRIDVHTGIAVTHINPKEHSLVTENHKTYRFDRLLLATGSVPARPPVEGMNGEHIYTIRTIQDVDRLKAFMQTKKMCCALIGGGLLGLETAYALQRTGVRVTVLEYFKRLMPRQLDPEGSCALQRMLEEKGLRFVLGAETVSIDEMSGEKFLKLREKDPVCADYVVVSAGIKPEIRLAKDAGLVTRKGIVVNDCMQTSKEHIFAAGDCAEHDGRIYGLWSAAMEQGEYAGQNMAGFKKEYRGTTVSTILKVAGIEVASLGMITDTPSPDVTSIVKKDEAGGLYKKLFLKDNILIGAILIGDNKAVTTLKRLINDKTEIAVPEDLL